jgi:hypothetical protein
MMKLREESLIAVVGLLVLAAAAVFAADQHARPGEERIAQDFQELVRGTGLGPAVDLTGCEFAFDPRICSRCSRDIGPLPLGAIFCPYHALSISSDRPLETGGIDFHGH